MDNKRVFNYLDAESLAYVETAADLGVDLSGKRPFTLEARVNFDGFATRYSLLSKPGFFNFGGSGRAIRFGWDGRPQAFLDTSKMPLDNKLWYQVVARYSDGLVRFFVNGRFINAASIGQPSVGDNGQAFTMAKDFQGLLRNVRVYQAALTPAQIQYLNYHDPRREDAVKVWFDFTSNPPKERVSNLPVELRDGARIMSDYRSLHLHNAAYARPLRDRDLNPGGRGDDPYTIQSWIYVRDRLSPKQFLFINYDATDHAQGLSVFLEWDNSAHGFRLCTQRGRFSSTDNTRKSTKALPAQKWTNVAVTFKDQVTTLYIDGDLVFSGAHANISPIADSHFLIGASLDGDLPAAEDCFQGYVSSVDVWDSALSQADVRKYMDEVDVTSEHHLAYYSFRDNPARNLMNGHPVSLVDGAVIEPLTSRAPAGAAEDWKLPAPAELTASKLPEDLARELFNEALLQEYRDSVRQVLNDFLAETRSGDAAEELQLDGEQARVLQLRCEEALAQMEEDPDLFIRPVVSYEADGYWYLCVKADDGAYAVLRADASLDPCTKWKMTFYFSVVWLLLSLVIVAVGVPRTITGVLGDFILKKVIPNPRVQAISQWFVRLLLGGGEPSRFVTQLKKLLQVLWNMNVIWPMVKLAFTWNWWQLVELFTYIVSWVIGVAEVQLMLEYALMIGNLLKIVKEKPTGCELAAAEAQEAPPPRDLQEVS